MSHEDGIGHPSERVDCNGHSLARPVAALHAECTSMEHPVITQSMKYEFSENGRGLEALVLYVSEQFV